MSNLHTFFIVGGTIIFFTLFFLFLAWLGKLWERHFKQRQKLVFHAQPRWILGAILTALLLLFIFIPLLACYYYFEFDKVVPDWAMFLSLFVSAGIIAVLAVVFLFKILSKGRVEIDVNCLKWRVGKEEGKILLSRPFKTNFGWFIRRYEFYSAGSASHTVNPPTIICDIEQDGKRYSFYYDASLDEISSLPETELRGIYLFQGAKLIMDRIKARRTKKKGLRYVSPV